MDVVEWHVEIAETADDLRGDDLLGGVAPVSCVGVDVDRLEQPDVVVVAKRLDTQVRGPGEVADGQRRGHDAILMSPTTGGSSSRFPLDLPMAGGSKVRVNRHVAEQGENEMNISLDTMPAPVRDYLTAMNALDSVGMVAPFASDGR